MHMVGLPMLDICPGSFVHWRIATGDSEDITESSGTPLPVTHDQRSELVSPRSARWYAVCVDIAGSIDLEALRLALEDFIISHSSLLSEFRKNGEEIQRYVIGRDRVHLEQFDGNVVSSNAEVVAYLRDHLEMHIDPLSWPAYTFSALVRDRYTTLVLAFDHIHVDLSSFALAASEIQELYTYRIDNRCGRLDPAIADPAQSSSASENRWDLPKVVESWRDFFSSCGDETPTFPLEVGTCPTVPVAQSTMEIELIDEQTAQQFEVWCRAHGGSFFSGLLAATAATAYALGGVKAYRSIAAFHNRDSATMGSFGWFAAGGPIDIPVNDGMTFAEVLKEAHASSRRAREFATVPFELVEANLNADVLLDNASWFSYMDYRRFPGANRHDEWNATIVCHERNGTQADIWVNRAWNRTYVHMRYPDNLLSERNVRLFACGMQEIMRGVASGKLVDGGEFLSSFLRNTD